MVLNIPANFESLPQWRLSTTTSDLYPPSPFTSRLATCHKAPSQDQESLFLSKADYSDTESSLSRSSSSASAIQYCSTTATSTQGDPEEDFNIPVDFEALEQLDLSTPSSAVFDPPSLTKPLEIRRPSEPLQQEYSPLPAPVSETDYSDTESTISRSSSSATSVKSSLTAATSTYDDHQEATKTPAVPTDAKPLTQQPTASPCRALRHTSLISSPALSRRSSTSSSTSAGSSASKCTSASRHSTGKTMPQALPSVTSSVAEVATPPTSEDASRVGSPTASPVSTPRAVSPVPSESSGRSFKSDPFDHSPVLRIPLEKRTPKLEAVVGQFPRSRPASIAASSDSRLSQGVLPSPREVEPPSSVRDSMVSFVESEAQTYAPSKHSLQDIYLRLAQVRVDQPQITHRPELPSKSVRFTTQK